MDDLAAINRLIEGNQRFVASKPIHPDQTDKRRVELIGGQHPFAAVLGCADSRVPPEIIFDQGLGDLFVVRLVGNVANYMTIGSLEYAVARLHVPLLVVLGHTGCGAVKAALTHSGESEGQIAAVISEIKLSIEAAGDRRGDADEVARVHARKMAQKLRSTEPILRQASITRTLRIISACYDIRTGVVEILEGAGDEI